MKVKNAFARWTTPDANGIYIGERVEPKTRKHRLSLGVHVVAAIGERDIGRLQKTDLRYLQQYCESRGHKPSTINNICHGVLFAMLRDFELEAVRLRLKGVKQLRDTSDPVPYAYTEAEREKAEAAFRGHWSHPFVRFSFRAGTRGGEACGLQWQDIDWTRRTARIMRSRERDKVTPCKTRRSQRVIALDSEAFEALKDAWNMPRPEFTRSADSFVFIGEKVEVISIPSFRPQCWRPRLMLAGLRPIRVHDTRHTWATCSLEAGWTLAAVAAQLGDRQSMVEARYSHVRPRPPDSDTPLSTGRPRLRLVTK